MCGIFGAFNFQRPLEKGEVDAFAKALETLNHRGPDFRDHWSEGGLFLGHTRLSIIDLKPESNQPFWDGEGENAIVYNGEVYNYLEMKAELQQQGVCFRTESDTELVLEAFKHYGPEAFVRFEGMFALAIFNKGSGKLTLARDHLGQKPLYVSKRDGGFFFASELRALLALPKMDWTLDRQAFLRYLSLGYYGYDDTALEEAEKLLPGTWLEIDGKGNVSRDRYWTALPGSGDANQPKAGLDELRHEVRRSCEISMRSDVPFGVFLSGGVDSTLVLSQCRKLRPDVQAFSVSMSEADFDESKRAKAIAKHLDIKNHEIYTFNPDNVVSCLEDFMEFIDEPHGDPGFVNHYFLTKACRDRITVALSGDGGDELFGGYISFLALNYDKILKRLPSPMVNMMKEGIRRFQKNDTYMGFAFKALSLLQGYPYPAGVRYPLWLSSSNPKDLKPLCPWAEEAWLNLSRPESSFFAEANQHYVEAEGDSSTRQLLRYYQRFFMPEFICAHTDRAAMQNSLEVRSPFLNRSLVEVADRMDDSMKFNGKQTKIAFYHLLKEEGFSDDFLLHKKQGFSFPIARWLKGSLSKITHSLLLDPSRLHEVVDRHVLENLVAEHMDGRRNHYRLIFNLMSFSSWYNRYENVHFAN
jgi:asparagine synthase (glutamine-hydrolysing)